LPNSTHAARPSPAEGGAAPTARPGGSPAPEREGPPPPDETGATETARLLSEFARVLNHHGPDSAESEAFLRRHGSNQEFIELARLSVTLKRALSIGRST
jgi:hypothetical protein